MIEGVSVSPYYFVKMDCYLSIKVWLSTINLFQNDSNSIYF